MPTAEFTPQPTPDPWQYLDPIVRDEAFARESREACARTRPAKLETMTVPERPLDKGPSFRTVQMLVAEVIGPDGPIAELPRLDDPEWQGYARTFRDDAVVARPADVELLACVALRTGQSANYGFTVYKVAEIVWIVDRKSGDAIGSPWVLGGPYAANNEFPSYLQAYETSGVGGLALLLPSPGYGQGDGATTSILAFLGRVTPAVGVFEQVHSWFGDDDLLLPVGFEVSGGQTSIVRLVVFAPGEVAFAEVFCAPDGIVNDKRLRIGTDLPIDLGRFAARSSGVDLTGDFVIPYNASGTIRGLDPAARSCGVPDEGEWSATRKGQLKAIRGAEGYILEVVPNE